MTLAAAAAVMLAQANAGQAQLDRIAWSQMIMAGGMIVMMLAVLAVGIAAVLLALMLRKLVHRLEDQVKALQPRIEPLLGAGSRIAADATETSAAVKARTEEVLQTVQELNGRLRALATDAEERVRELGAVLDVVQAEAREILLDAASTARGVHTTAERLQAARGTTPARREE